MRCEVGDIILAYNFTYPDGSRGTLHNFVVMAINQDEFTLVNLEYLCFLISSHVDKNNDTNPNYPFNEPLHPSADNGLRDEGHVKCDYVFEHIKEDDIIMRVGIVTPEQFTRFMELYAQSGS